MPSKQGPIYANEKEGDSDIRDKRTKTKIRSATFSKNKKLTWILFLKEILQIGALIFKQ